MPPIKSTETVSIHRTFQYRIYPTKAQEAELERRLGLLCDIYNACLEQRRTAWARCGKQVSRYEQQRELTELRAEDSSFGNLPAHLTRDPLQRLERAYQGFFRRCKAGKRPGHPRYRSKRRYDSMTYPDQWGWKLLPDTLTMTGIGTVRARLHRPVEGQVRTLTIKRLADGWYAFFSCAVERGLLVHDGPTVGIDLGLISQVATSDGETIPAPKHYRKRQRTDHAHKVSRDLMRRYCFASNFTALRLRLLPFLRRSILW